MEASCPETRRIIFFQSIEVNASRKLFSPVIISPIPRLHFFFRSASSSLARCRATSTIPASALSKTGRKAGGTPSTTLRGVWWFGPELVEQALHDGIAAFPTEVLLGSKQFLHSRAGRALTAGKYLESGAPDILKRDI
jgi:hypothetical protein